MLNKYIFKKTKQAQRGATSILLTIFILSMMLLIAMTAANVMIYQIRMSREISDSVVAFMAADAAAEQCLYRAREVRADPCHNNGTSISVSLGNGATAEATRVTSNSVEATGNFNATRRKVKIEGNITGGTDADVKLLLHADNSGNVFYDNSLSQKIVIAQGDAIQKDDQHAFSSGLSAYFDGAGDYLTLTDSADWEFAAGDFTIDFWAYNLGGSNGAVWQAADADYGAVFGQVSGNTLTVSLSGNGTSWNLINSQSLGALPDFSWTHYAAVRSGSTLYTFRNGEIIEQQSISGIVNTPAGVATVGRFNGPGASVQHLSGYIDELRVSKGVARWTANFEPPIM
ncbi:MAG: LamG domain-containing protein, partial [Patescibacteria group bacterium]